MTVSKGAATESVTAARHWGGRNKKLAVERAKHSRTQLRLLLPPLSHMSPDVRLSSVALSPHLPSILSLTENP